ncbi:MAG: hypothetical protein H7836_04520 [Magnetococcus sp. YQC-3]
MGNFWSDIIGTSKDVFKIKKGKLSLDAVNVLANRTITFGDSDIDLNTASVGQVLKKIGANSIGFAAEGGGGAGYTEIANNGTISGTYQGDVFCLGNVNVNGTTVVRGNLFINGNFTTLSAPDLTVFGNLKVVGYMDMSPPSSMGQGTVTVHGNTYIGSDYVNEPFENGTYVTPGNGQEQVTSFVYESITSIGIASIITNVTSNSDFDVSGDQSMNIAVGQYLQFTSGGASGEEKIVQSVTFIGPDTNIVLTSPTTGGLSISDNLQLNSRGIFTTSSTSDWVMAGIFTPYFKVTTGPDIGSYYTPSSYSNMMGTSNWTLSSNTANKINVGDIIWIEPKRMWQNNSTGLTPSTLVGVNSGPNAGETKTVSNVWNDGFFNLFIILNSNFTNDLTLSENMYIEPLQYIRPFGNFFPKNTFRKGTVIKYLTGGNAGLERSITTAIDPLYYDTTAITLNLSAPLVSVPSTSDTLYTKVKTSLRSMTTNGGTYIKGTFTFKGDLVVTGSISLRSRDDSTNVEQPCDLFIGGNLINTDNTLVPAPLCDLRLRNAFGNMNLRPGNFTCYGDVIGMSIDVTTDNQGNGGAGDIFIGGDFLGRVDFNQSPFSGPVGQFLDATGMGQKGGNIDVVGDITCLELSTRSYNYNGLASNSVTPGELDGGRLTAKNIYCLKDIILNSGVGNSYVGTIAQDIKIKGNVYCYNFYASVKNADVSEGQTLRAGLYNPTTVVIEISGSLYCISTGLPNSYGNVVISGTGSVASPMYAQNGTQLYVENIVCQNFYSRGGDGGGAGGGRLYAKHNVAIYGTCDMSGGYTSYSGMSAGQGGRLEAINVHVASQLMLTGGYSGTAFSAGIGGTLTCKQFDGSSLINVSGGEGLNAGLAQGGGTITCDFMRTSQIYARGGNGAQSNGGQGGTINVRHLIVTSNISAYGGNTSSSTTQRTSGAGAGITCDDLYCPNIDVSGGSSVTTNNNGGNSGNITINGNLRMNNGTLSMNGGAGGSLAARNGGSGGLLTVYGIMQVATLNMSGGNAGGTGGSCGQFKFLYGCTIQNITAIDGTGTAPTTARTMELGGSCYIGAWNIANRTTVKLGGPLTIGAGSTSTVYCNSRTGKTVMRKSAGTETASSTSAMYYDGTNWNSITNAVIV